MHLFSWLLADPIRILVMLSKLEVSGLGGSMAAHCVHLRNYFLHSIKLYVCIVLELSLINFVEIGSG